MACPMCSGPEMAYQRGHLLKSIGRPITFKSSISRDPIWLSDWLSASPFLFPNMGEFEVDGMGLANSSSISMASGPG